MLDPKLLRSDLESVAAKLNRRGFDLDVAAFSALEEKRKSLQVETQNLQNERNTRSKGIGKAKAQGEDIQPLLDEVAALGDKLNLKKRLGPYKLKSRNSHSVYPIFLMSRCRMEKAKRIMLRFVAGVIFLNLTLSRKNISMSPLARAWILKWLPN